MFSVVVSNTIAPSYQWCSNSVALPGETSSILVLSNVPGLTQTASFNVTIADGPCTISSSSAQLTVLRPPVIVTNPQPAWVCSNGAAMLNVLAGNFPIYQWCSNGVPIPGATNSTVTVPAGSYDVILANACGSVTSTTATVTAVSPVGLLAQPASQTVCQGGSAVFVAFPNDDSGPVAFQWRKNAVNIAGATHLFYSLTNVSDSDAGTYSCVMSNSCGAVTSSNATLTVTLCILVSTNGVWVPEGATAGFTVRLSGQPSGSLDVTTTRTVGATNLSVTGGGSIQFRGSNWNMPQPVTLSAALDADAVSESAVFTVSANGLSNVMVTAFEIDKDAPPEINSIEPQTNGFVQILVQGYPGSNYLLRAATNLALPVGQWTVISTNTTDTNGAFHFIIPDPLALPQRFFRASKP
jgi:hypothetical protein